MYQSATFKVIGSQRIACSGCEQAIRRSLVRMSGVREVKADHQTQRVVVHFEMPQIDVASLQARLQALGYGVEVVSGSASPHECLGERGESAEPVAESCALRADQESSPILRENR